MQEKDNTRRKVLIGLTSAVGLSGVPFVATPFIAAWNPSARAKAAGASVKIDVSKMQYGQQIQVAWRKQPVFVIRQTKESLAGLEQTLSKLSDPNSEAIDEPYRGLNATRSKSSEYSVIAGVCTHLGCAPTHHGDDFDQFVDGVPSGFFCPCHGSKFDMAGRVFQGVPAPLNLVVPEHSFINDDTLLIGVSSDTSKGDA